jgi:hypothetical protein
MRFSANRRGIGEAHGGDTFVGVFEEDGKDLFEAIGIDRAAEPLEDFGIEDGVLFGIVRATGVVSAVENRDTAGKGGAEGFRGKGLFEDGVVAIEVGRRSGAHRQEQGARSGFTQRKGERGAVEAGHPEVGKDTVGWVGGGKLHSLSPILRLLHQTALGFEEHRRDGKTHGVVVDREDASWSGGRAGGHVGTILHTECDGFTLHLRCFNGIFAGCALAFGHEGKI